MPLIGVRELRERTTEVLRQVREERAEYVITHQGRPVAVLLPVASEHVEAAMLHAAKGAAATAWDAYAQVAESLRDAWPSDQSTQAVLDDIRET